mmetsp:Transcript_15485/g.34571  ORF Transcript_15485/g.34571 Transcript_15485/m.34571 type:complete len:236 (-) Transcript_15485:136-843(-)
MPPSQNKKLVQRRPLLEAVVMVAIAIWILHQILLMLFVSLIKGISLKYSGNHLVICIPSNLLGIDKVLQFTPDFGCNLLLRIAIGEHNRCILSTHIIALPIRRRWIMKHVKEFHQLFKVLVGIVQFDIQNFYVASCSAANGTIRRILDRRNFGRHESHLGALDAVGEPLLKINFDVLFRSPVATCSQSDNGMNGGCSTGTRTSTGICVGAGGHAVSGYCCRSDGSIDNFNYCLLW